VLCTRDRQIKLCIYINQKYAAPVLHSPLAITQPLHRRHGECIDMQRQESMYAYGYCNIDNVTDVTITSNGTRLSADGVRLSVDGTRFTIDGAHFLCKSTHSQKHSHTQTLSNHNIYNYAHNDFRQETSNKITNIYSYSNL
jgi:hypothetical protein